MGRIRRSGTILDSYSRHRASSGSKKKNLTPSWPTGAGGPLVVTSGNTYTFDPGSNYDFSSVDIQAGATINTSQGTSPICIGCLGNFSLDPAATWNAFLNDDTGGTYSRTAPDGTTISYSIVQSSGGSGGNARGGSATGGTSSFGSGGGGAGSGFSGNPSVGNGGDDSSIGGGAGGGGNGGSPASGGLAGTNSGDGGDGGGGSGDSNAGFAGAGGGAGGGRGYHGQGYYIKIGGQTNCLGAQIDLSGRQGGVGGDGGSADGGVVSIAGAGAGGGSGGSGGFAKFRDKGTGTGRPDFIISGGTLGANGIAGTSDTGDDATDGFGGSNGSAGSTDIGTW